MYVNSNGDNLFTKCSFCNINKNIMDYTILLFYYVSKLSELIGIIDTTFIASIFCLIFATQKFESFFCRNLLKFS
jgi:hypothetical protein